MTAPIHLRTLILSSTAVSDLIGTRCHYNKLPEASARPHVWFRVASDVEERTLDTVGGIHEATVDIECVATTETIAQSISDAVKGKLDGYKGTMGSITAKGCFLMDKDDDYIPFANESDDGAHVVAHELHMWYTT